MYRRKNGGGGGFSSELVGFPWREGSARGDLRGQPLSIKFRDKKTRRGNHYRYYGGLLNLKSSACDGECPYPAAEEGEGALLQDKGNWYRREERHITRVPTDVGGIEPVSSGQEELPLRKKRKCVGTLKRGEQSQGRQRSVGVLSTR